MKYAIIEDNKCTFIDDDRQRLVDTLAFIPEKTDSDIVELADDAVVQGYDGAFYLAGFEPEIPADVAMAQAKSDRAEAVSKITVTVDGMVFDGDETAQDRMARAITMFQANNLPVDYQTDWVLADNTIAKVTVTQLSQALLLAGQAQTALWTVPYQNEETNAGNE